MIFATDVKTCIVFWGALKRQVVMIKHILKIGKHNDKNKDNVIFKAIAVMINPIGTIIIPMILIPMVITIIVTTIQIWWIIWEIWIITMANNR